MTINLHFLETRQSEVADELAIVEYFGRDFELLASQDIGRIILGRSIFDRATRLSVIFDSNNALYRGCSQLRGVKDLELFEELSSDDAALKRIAGVLSIMDYARSRAE